jgi:hypothetical protein
MSLILGILDSGGAAAGAGAVFDSISTVTVGGGGAADVEFTSIPATYTHLQIRAIGKASGSGGAENPVLRFNSDSGNNYAAHRLQANGSTASADAFTSVAQIRCGFVPDSSGGVTSMFGNIIVDILDYANTNKYKTVRLLGGADLNGSGTVILSSGLWQNTAAITSIKIFNNGLNWVQYTQFALYGIKGS